MIRQLVVALALVVACTDNGGGNGGGSGSGSGSGSGGGSGSSSAGVELTIGSASSTDEISSVMPQAGDVFIIVDITLANSGAKAALSTNPVLFTVTSDQALVYNAAPVEPPNACDSSVSVASGGTMSCSLAFQVPSAATLKTLGYNDQQGDTATVAMPAISEPSAACTTVYGWIANPPANCFECVESAQTGTCASEGSAYSACTTCGSTCQDSTNPCACETGCDSASCQMTFGVMMMCVEAECQSICG
ncbi:MAG TPA: DUF4352 domain-containing protein [Kofleriaceae bacterium]|nr:DUF4352 domain-containing protein [Kofleriaceae bacterium]